MTTIPAEFRDRVRVELSAARVARRSGDRNGGWQLPEAALVLSRPWALGSHPIGKTGRAMVSATRPMPIRNHAAELAQEEGR